MAVYNINGGQPESVFDVAGYELQQAYDVKGNELLTPVANPPLIVMSYNVGDFTGINAQQTMQNIIATIYHTHIIGIQEFYKTDVVPTIASNMLSNYPYLYRTNHKNFNAVASKIALSDVSVADYVNQDAEDMTQFGETRSYIKGYLQKNGKTICVINTHLCYLTTSVKYAQMAEVFALAQQEEYCIILGDFNFFAMSVEEEDYIQMYKPFVDAGYNLANCTADRGFNKTYSHQNTASTQADLQNAPDNIIVSGNIEIDSVVYDMTKLSYLNGEKIDHIPIVATLIIPEG